MGKCRIRVVLRFQGGYAKTCFLALAAAIYLSYLASPACAQTSLFLTDAPSWTHYVCDGAEADPNGSAALQGLHCYSNLTVPAGSTLTVTNVLSASGTPQDTPRGALFAFVSGTCSIYGTINASATNTGYANGGGAGGGGGGGSSAAGQPGLSSTLFGSGGVVAAAPGGAGGAAGASGAAGSTPTSNTQRFIWNLGITLGVFGGSAGGAGGMGSGNAALGGPGGGAIVLVCGTIDFTGSLDVSGGAGAAGAQGGGGGGGGGAGAVLMAASNYLNAAGAIILNGGAGGFGDSGAAPGGSGGAGWSKQFTFN
jgi:hypothetical protein